MIPSFFYTCLFFFSNSFIISFSLVCSFFMCSFSSPLLTLKYLVLSSAIGISVVVLHNHRSSLSICMSWLSSLVSTFSHLESIFAFIFVFSGIWCNVKL